MSSQQQQNETFSEYFLRSIICHCFLYTYLCFPEIKISSSRSLKAQLNEIAPMNSERAKIFCPNGPSSNVSPLMENKCGDRMAIPSVYGRTEDTVGNSIPGFNGGYYPSVGGGTGSLSASPDIGGFPSYK